MTAEGVYKRLLTAFPARFRREYGDGMLEAFRDLRQHTARGPLAFWLFVIADTIRGASFERALACRELLQSNRARWMMACAAGATACGALGSLATWAFSYFYHPYLEGTAFVPWVYGATLGAGLALVQALALGRRLPRRTLWIVTSACCAALGVEIAISIARVAGPIGYAVAFGSVVAGGQWIVLRGRLPLGQQGAAWWVLPSAGGLSAVVMSTRNTLTAALAGMGAIGNHPEATPGLYLLLRGLYAPTTWTEAAVGFAVMATTGLLVGAITAKPISSLARAR
jgi:hypothetical protein